MGIFVKIGLLSFRQDAKRAGSTSHYVHCVLDRADENEVLHLASKHGSKMAGNSMSSRLRRRCLSMFSETHGPERNYVKKAILNAEQSDCDIIVGCFCANVSDMLERTRIPIVYITDINSTQIEGFDPEVDVKKVALEKRMYALSAACILPSKFVADSAVRDYGLEASKVHVVEWGGADTGVGTGQMEQFPERSSHPIELLFIGHKRYRKGLDRAIRSVEAMVAEGHDVRLRTIGRQDELESNSNVVDDLGRLDLKNTQDKKTFEEAFSRASCLIHPARSEPYGHVLVEACTRSLPVVCTAVGGMTQIIQDDFNGLVVPEPFEQKRLDDAVRRLITDPEMVSRLGKQAHLESQNRLNWSSWLEQVQPILKSILVSEVPKR